MTREEKSNLLNELLEYEENNDIGNLTRAERREFQQWISGALEQQSSYNSVKSELEPCEDAISREEAINELKLAYFNKDLQSAKDDPCIVDAMTDWAIRTIKNLPSVTPFHEDLKEAYIKGYDYGVKDWFKAKTEPCDDCISRKDALKAIEEQKKGFYGVERYAIDECHSAIMKLPSVRPYREIVEDKRACEKCIHYVTRDSKGVVLCGCDSWECDFEEVKT